MTDKTYKRDQVVEIIGSVLGRMHAPEHAQLGRDLSELRTAIEGFLAQMQDARPADIRRTHIPAAQDELDAVVSATEQATVAIMAACEDILGAVKTAPEGVARAVEAAAVRIFEACTFQDITGQRIRKVTGSLRQIDAKISSILAAIGGEAAQPSPSPAAGGLLNGPALPQNAVSQDEIDRLLAAFDDTPA